LAHAINEIKTNVRDYENGKMVPSGTTIVKMEKVLGCKLPRPIKKKIGE
jgi:ribosome-binding protein aMBF1 (putative translation factor)